MFTGTSFYPQLQISLIEIKRIIGVISIGEAYFHVLLSADNSNYFLDI